MAFKAFRKKMERTGKGKKWCKKGKPLKAKKNNNNNRGARNNATNTKH